MKYIKTQESWIEESSPGLITRILRFLKPKLGDKIKNQDEIRYWFLEVTSEGQISREIGFDCEDTVIHVAPFLIERGQWTDSNIVIDYSAFDEITKSEFEERWSIIVTGIQ